MTESRSENNIGISVVIICRDEPLLLQCIQSVDRGIEVVIVLNDPSAEVEEIARRVSEERNVVIVRIPLPGIARALNAGISAAFNDWIFLLDSDCTCRPTTIAGMSGYRDRYRVIRGSVVFNGRNFFERVVARTRNELVNRNLSARHPPLLFDRSIVHNTGTWFHDALQWSEDTDFDRRVRAAGISIGDAREFAIDHKPLSMATDLRSAVSYGVGREIGKELGIYTPHSLKSRINNVRDVFLRARAINSYAGLSSALYYFLIWNSAFRLGTCARRHFNWTPSSWHPRSQ